MEIWKKIPTFSKYEISTEGRVRNVESGKLKTISYQPRSDCAFVNLYYNGKAYCRFVPKLLNIVFGIKVKRRGGSIAKVKEIEIEKEGYFKF